MEWFFCYIGAATVAAGIMKAWDKLDGCREKKGASK